MRSIDYAFEVAKREREYQGKAWPRDSHPLAAQYVYAAPHVLLLERYVEKAGAQWEASHDEVDVLRTLAKALAVAVRALEELALVVFNADLQTTQEAALTRIRDERSQQDAKHPRNKDNSGQYQFSAPHILLAKDRLQVIRAAWYESDRVRMLNEIVVLAAILTRALQEIDGPDLLEIGLR